MSADAYAEASSIVSESLGSVRTVLAFNAVDRAAEEYNEVRSTRNPCPNHLLVTGCAM